MTPIERAFAHILVRKGGLEPPRLAAPDPKSGASANSATLAIFEPNGWLLPRFCHIANPYAPKNRCGFSQAGPSRPVSPRTVLSAERNRTRSTLYRKRR